MAKMTAAQMTPTNSNIQALSHIDSRKWAMYPPLLHELRCRVMSHPHIEAAISAGEACLELVQPSPAAMYGGERVNGCRYTYKRGNIAVIGVNGTLFASGGWYDDIMAFYFGGTSTQALMKDVQIAGDDPEIEGIVLRINSGGGEAFGINELANLVHATRSKKPIVAYIYGYGASAAYWIAAGCDKIYPDASALLGSIGVVCGWADFTGMYEMFGIAYEEVTSSNAPYKRLDIREPEERAVFMSEIDGMEKVFIDSIAKFRNVKRDVVISDFGKGAVMAGHLAVKAGMADQANSFEGVLKQLTADQKKAGRGYSAEHGESDMSFKEDFRSFMKSMGFKGDEQEAEAATLNESSTLSSDRAVDLFEDLPDADISADEEKVSEVKMEPKSIAEAEETETATTDTEDETQASETEDVATESQAAASPAPVVDMAAREQALADREKALEDREKAAKEAQLEAKAAIRKVDFEKVAAGFAGDSAAKVAFMESLADKFGENSAEFKVYVEDQTALAAQLDAGSLFAETGAPGTESGVDAATKLDAMAKERAQKDGITYAKAYSIVLSENRQLGAAAIEAGDEIAKSDG